MIYEAKNYESLIGIKGLSEALLKTHFTLYQGYVKNTNKLKDLLMDLLKNEKTATSEFAELKRRLGWEFNGMRLHELYFGNITKRTGTWENNSEIAKQMIHNFGSYALWEKEIKAVASIRGIGWAVLYYDTIGKCLFNTWINEHDAGHLSGCVPLLVIDVFEHAYLIDYGLKRTNYVDSILRVIDWKVVEKRLVSQDAVKNH